MDYNQREHSNQMNMGRYTKNSANARSRPPIFEYESLSTIFNIRRKSHPTRVPKNRLRDENLRSLAE